VAMSVGSRRARRRTDTLPGVAPDEVPGAGSRDESLDDEPGGGDDDLSDEIAAD
jgi:hypothetical protein